MRPTTMIFLFCIGFFIAAGLQALARDRNSTSPPPAKVGPADVCNMMVEKAPRDDCLAKVAISMAEKANPPTAGKAKAEGGR